MFDSDPVRRIAALGDGFAIPERNQAFAFADVIFGATGNRSVTAEDLPLLRNGAILVSCSSRDVEFDLQAISDLYETRGSVDGIEAFCRKRKTLYLVFQGYPVNFRDGAVIGPALALVQAEIIVALKHLLAAKAQAGLQELPNQQLEELAQAWLQEFCDDTTGFYCQV